jgi:hypothetical protein
MCARSESDRGDVPGRSAARPVLLLLLLLGGGGAGLLALRTLVPGAAAEVTAPTPQVLEAVRLLLSDDAREEARGEHALRRLGAAVVPQLRYWVRKVRSESDRVETLLRELEGLEKMEPSAATTTASDFLYRKLLAARELARESRHREALALSEALLLLDTDNPYAWELRRLVRQSRRRLAAKELLEPSIEVGKLVYESGESPRVNFRLTNHKRDLVRIGLQGGFVGEVDMVVTRRFLDGSMRRDGRKLQVRVPANVPAILIGPAQAWECAVEMETEGLSPLEGAVARCQVEGRFRPHRWTSGSEEPSVLENLSLEVPMAEFWIVPQGQKDLCERPLEKLTAALLFKKEAPSVVAGWVAVWSAEEDRFLNDKLVDTLVSHIGELEPPMLDVAGQLLAAATGQSFGSEPVLWATWWEKVNAERRDRVEPGSPAPR